jgi:hypothetical protein
MNIITNDKMFLKLAGKTYSIFGIDDKNIKFGYIEYNGKTNELKADGLDESELILYKSNFREIYINNNDDTDFSYGKFDNIKISFIRDTNNKIKYLPSIMIDGEFVNLYKSIMLLVIYDLRMLSLIIYETTLFMYKSIDDLYKSIDNKKILLLEEQTKELFLINKD